MANVLTTNRKRRTSVNVDIVLGTVSKVDGLEASEVVNQDIYPQENKLDSNQVSDIDKDKVNDIH